MIVPMGTRDNSVSEMSTPVTTIDSTLTGDPFAAQWAVYCSGGLQSSHFDLRPTSFEIRSLLQSYRPAGVVCEEDPPGVAQSHAIPGTKGKKTIVTTEDGPMFSRNSHLPHANALSLIDESIIWPTCAGLDR